MYNLQQNWLLDYTASCKSIVLIPYNVKAGVIITCRLYYDLGLCPVSCNNESMSSAVLSEAVSLASSLDVSSRSFYDINKSCCISLLFDSSLVVKIWSHQAIRH